MAKKTVKTESDPVVKPEPKTEITVGQSELAQALVAAIEAAKPPAKITAANRKRKGTPWTPPPGVARAKLKRKAYHHGMPIESKILNEEIELLNQIRPGLYCDGHVRVVRRRDKGIDIDYPVRTAAQRLRLVNQFGIRNFKELLERIVDEGANPVKYKSEDELD